MTRGTADSPGVDARDACSPLNSTPSCKVEKSSVARSSSPSLSRRLGHADLAMYGSRSTSRCLAGLAQTRSEGIGIPVVFKELG